MHPLIAVLGATAACALAMVRPPDGLPPPEEPRALLGALRQPVGGFVLPRYLRVPRYPDLDLDQARPISDYDNWLSREIERLNFLEAEDELESNYQTVDRLDEATVEGPLYRGLQERLVKLKRDLLEASKIGKPTDESLSAAVANPPPKLTREEKKKQFALTPHDKGYYDDDSEPGPAHTTQSLPVPLPIQRGEPPDVFEAPRQTRQNPNLSKNKNLVADNLDKLRAGVSSEDGGPGRSGFQIEGTPAEDPSESFYGIAVIAAAGAALTVTALVFAFGWYTISKKAKAAADVDYPAYGVTGPAVDVSGDRKLAHSAHMYHYQHQKQQILAMERNGQEQRDGSVSDPESEEENEEGDYTVYECPGFATTGDMEVKNPMFSEEPTPATPGKCELVKPQPKE